MSPKEFHFFDDPKEQELVVYTTELHDGIVKNVRFHSFLILEEIFKNLPDSPLAEKINKYFEIYCHCTHLLTFGLMRESGQLSDEEFKPLAQPSVMYLARYLREAKTSGELL